MGGLLSTSGQPKGPNSKIPQDISCTKCGKNFTKNSSYGQLYSHEKICKEKPSFPKKYKNSPNIGKNDKEIIKNIITENRNKISKKENPRISENLLNDPPENHVNVVREIMNYDKYPSNKNITSEIKISRGQNRNYTQQFLSSNLNEELKLSKEENFNIRIPHSKKLTKNNNKKISVSTKSITESNLSNYKDFPFEEKLFQFKKHIQSLKIDWREGACTLNLDRDDILAQSMQQFIHIDPYKELKINFKGEVSHDAGGLIREWFTVVFKELQKENLGKNYININITYLI